MRSCKLFVTFILILIFSQICFALTVSDNLNINGFGMFHYSKTDKSGSKEIVEYHPIYLNFDFKVNEYISSFLEFEYEHLPASGAGEIKVERAYIDLVFNDLTQFQFGKIFVPAGIWMPIHWRILTPTYDRVIFFQNKGHFIPSHQVGVNYYGKYYAGDNVLLNWAAWLTLGDASKGTNKADTEFDNLGGNLSVQLFDMFTIGASFQNLNATVDYDRDQDSLLIFSQLKLFNESVIISAEKISSELTARYANEANYRDLDAFYVGIEYNFLPDWTVYVRQDKGDDIKRSPGGVTIEEPDPDTKINSIALTWAPWAGTQIRVEYLDYSFDDSSADYKKYQLTFGQLF